MKLRDYEQDWIARIKASSSRRILIVGPTGCGKTVVAVSLIRDALKRNERVLFIAHRVELVNQAKQRLIEHGVKPGKVGTIRAGEDENRSAMIQVASVQSLARREKPGADIVFIDEAHHASAVTYRKILESYPNAKVIGLTATPYRLDGKPLGDLFEEITESAKPSELIEKNWIQRPRVWTVPIEERANIKNVKTLAGDFNVGQLEAESNKKKLVGSIVDHWKRLADGRPTVCYAVSVRHANRIAKAFRDADVTSGVVSGETPPEERSELLRSLKSGSISVLVNCMVLTEGWDCPEARCAIVARPTMSQSLWFQMCGRIMRPNDKSPIVLDHAGNALWLPLPGDDVEYSLETEQRKKANAKTVKEKTCKECGNRLFLGCRVCPNCGFEFWTGEPPEEVTGELSEAYRDSDEIRGLYSRGKSIETIAKRYMCASRTIRAVLVAGGLKIRTPGESLMFGIALSEKAIVADYKKGKSALAIAKKIGCSSHSVYLLLKRKGVKIRTLSEAKLGHLINEDDVVSGYLSGKSTIKISHEVGCSRETVAGCLKRRGVTMRGPIEGRYSPLNEELIISRYTDGYSVRDIANELNHGRERIREFIKRSGIAMRNRGRIPRSAKLMVINSASGSGDE